MFWPSTTGTLKFSAGKDIIGSRSWRRPQISIMTISLSALRMCREVIGARELKEAVKDPALSPLRLDK